jgi:hypothetical protein
MTWQVLMQVHPEIGICNKATVMSSSYTEQVHPHTDIFNKTMTYSLYIYKVLKQVHSDTGISKQGNDIFLVHLHCTEGGPPWYWYLKQGNDILFIHLQGPETGPCTSIASIMYHISNLYPPSILIRHCLYISCIPNLSAKLLVHLQGPEAGPPWYWYFRQGNAMTYSLYIYKRQGRCSTRLLE